MEGTYIAVYIGRSQDVLSSDVSMGGNWDGANPECQELQIFACGGKHQTSLPANRKSSTALTHPLPTGHWVTEAFSPARPISRPGYKPQAIRGRSHGIRYCREPQRNPVVPTPKENPPLGPSNNGVPTVQILLCLRSRSVHHFTLYTLSTLYLLSLL